MLKTEANPGGLPVEVFDGLRAGSIADRSKLYKDLASGPFFGFNRPGAKVSQGMIDSFWFQGMQSSRRHQGQLSQRGSSAVAPHRRRRRSPGPGGDGS